MATRSLNPTRRRAVEPFRPASPFLSFYRQANRLFEDVFREFDDTRDALGGILAPSIDVVQDEQEVRITAELPGVKEDDIDVSVDGDVLTLRAESASSAKTATTGATSASVPMAPSSARFACRRRSTPARSRRISTMAS